LLVPAEVEELVPVVGLEWALEQDLTLEPLLLDLLHGYR
jgi:hypothetical protein